MRGLRAAAPLMIALSLLAAPARAAGPFAECAGAAPFEVGDRNVIVAPRGDRLLGLINFAAVLASAPEGERVCRMAATAQAVAAKRLADPAAQRFAQIELIIALVDNMDEYARPNYAGMRHLGRITFARSGEGVTATQGAVTLAP
jgi:hypothetical protein